MIFHDFCSNEPRKDLTRSFALSRNAITPQPQLFPSFKMQLLKSFTIATVLLAFTDARPHEPNNRLSSRQSKIATTVIAGVMVPNTPIVQAAQAYARAHSDDMTFNHVMRSWLFG